MAQRLDGLTGHGVAQVLDTLAAAQAANGSFAEAQSTARQALELARRSGNEGFAQRVEGHLRLFESGRGLGE